MTPVSSRDWALLAALLLYSAVPVLGGTVRLVELSGGIAIAPPNPRALGSPLPIVLHIIGSVLFCTLGAVQFIPSFRQLPRANHRLVGLVAATGGLLSACTGLWMTLVFPFPPTLQGPALLWARVALSLSMVAAIFLAVRAVRQGNLPGHRAQMLRAYAIGQGASTQSILGIFALLATGAELEGIPRDSLMILAWVLNLALAEHLIHKRKPA